MRSRLAAIAACLALGASAAAQDLEPIPLPNLDEVESAVVEQLGDQRALVERLVAASGSDPAALAEAMGRLGELYILYELLGPAEPALANASRLAPDDLRWLYLRATIVQEQRRLDEARTLLERVLEIDPEYLPALIRSGEVESADGNVEAARSAFERALEIAPSSPAANWGLGQLAYGEGDSERAVTHFEAVLAIQPGATAVHYPLGLAYRDLGDIDKARQHLTQRGDTGIDKVDPLVDDLARLVTGSSLYMVRGNQAFARGNLPIAIAAYRGAVEADPDNVVAREALASALSRHGDFAAALEQIDWVIENGHAGAGTYYNLATIQSQQGALQESLDGFRKSLELDPELIDAHYNLGLLLERMNRADDALGHYEAILALDPQDTSARIRHAGLVAGQGRTAEARTALESVLTTDPGNSEALLMLGDVLQASGAAGEALEVYLRLAASAADVESRARGHYAAGRLQLDRGATDEAVLSLSRAVELLPRIVEARLTLATALGRAGRFAEAATEYARLIEQNPDIETAHLGRALSLLLAGRDTAAETALRSSLEHFPRRRAVDPLAEAACWRRAPIPLSAMASSRSRWRRISSSVSAPSSTPRPWRWPWPRSDASPRPSTSRAGSSRRPAESAPSPQTSRRACAVTRPGSRCARPGSEADEAMGGFLLPVAPARHPLREQRPCRRGSPLRRGRSRPRLRARKRHVGRALLQRDDGRRCGLDRL